jgi:hypothetical protein
LLGRSYLKRSAFEKKVLGNAGGGFEGISERGCGRWWREEAGEEILWEKAYD